MSAAGKRLAPMAAITFEWPRMMSKKSLSTSRCIDTPVFLLAALTQSLRSLTGFAEAPSVS